MPGLGDVVGGGGALEPRGGVMAGGVPGGGEYAGAVAGGGTPGALAAGEAGADDAGVLAGASVCAPAARPAGWAC